LARSSRLYKGSWRPARHLSARSWCPYELVARACVVSLQSVQATLNRSCSPQSRETSFRKFVCRAEKDGTRAADDAEHISPGVKVRSRSWRGPRIVVHQL
jgi:hypothetical protein